MLIQVKSASTTKYLGYIAGYAIYDGISWVLVAKDGEVLEEHKVEHLVVMSVNEEGGSE